MAGKDSPRPQSWRWFSNLDSSYILLIKLILLQYSFEINACIFYLLIGRCLDEHEHAPGQVETESYSVVD